MKNIVNLWFVCNFVQHSTDGTKLRMYYAVCMNVFSQYKISNNTVAIRIRDNTYCKQLQTVPKVTLV